ncbi:MATE family efflux transporter [Lactococcus cremoris]|jgi:putative MATE family efflux protein|uniref:Probable multidrug resistance protein NorM n=4 Tax=Lactococcus lactis subsp. cremoris TaxID=1359 RepID=T0T989_LACLC|nr:MATE family efflux transporter [Lactococcus cremoris]EQC53919.1 multidrug transporter [Lactococcus cremoris subsp. cremoris TIFN6]EQC93277.1 multidrug transporter [Lactococcus cremoris subsp. cremoris TIFN3]MDU1525202.1 MATE family efflux transporter [Lactococcus lactis]ABJ73850.1 Na+-driven multidrug efflux pump [Lactococcus cremoris subsp. cremoris SK11]AEU41619.1 Na+ driven multidrug efflux pump [Lactococcus cremoris subsp. cremoris A76]
MKTNKEILKFALPAIIENFLQMLVGVSDTMIVAHLSLSAVAAVSLANNLITVYQAIFIALGTIISSLFAKVLIEKKAKEKLKELINSATKLTVLIGLVFGLFSLFAAQPILYLLGARQQVLELSIIYLSLVGGLIVLLALMTTFGAFLRADGNTKTPMWASFFASVLNLLFSIVFIFVFHLGVLGTALGAVLARVIGTAFLYYKLKEKRPSLQFYKVKLNRQLIKLSLPAAGERLSMRLGDLLIMMIIVRLGERVFAGNAIGESITQFNYMPVFGMATVTVILVAQATAENNIENIKSYIKKTYWLATSMMFVIGLVLLLTANMLNHLFTTDRIAMGASTIVILFSFLATFFVTGATTYTAAFQGIGNTKLPFYATTLGMFGIRLILGAFLALVLKLGLEGVWLAVLLDNFFRFVFLKIKFKKTLITEI